jgi:hypothetical protein
MGLSAPVFFLHHLYGDGIAGKLGGEDGLHVVSHIHALPRELFYGVRDGRNLDVPVACHHGRGIVGID